ncbi:hypothetical protein HYG81_18925 [Natrinema zhouii]|uniref:hypothetical protein n=1 Tax=Natrinema zhouii TaxID=1710539 RepID=UPI001CFFECF9|nr:hypothetical protein [Natrinema zhouii]UHQ97937.1 hypothetical protein HYG81_18925 [Natrinema zhouii]
MIHPTTGTTDGRRVDSVSSGSTRVCHTGLAGDGDDVSDVREDEQRFDHQQIADSGFKR